MVNLNISYDDGGEETAMAQLVKLDDYISRYQLDVYRYSSRYNRLKAERWDRLKNDWNKRKERYKSYAYDEIVTSSYGIETEKRTIGWKRWLPFGKGNNDKKAIREEDRLSFSETFERPISSIEALKKTFHEELYSFQLNWASSTVTEKSYVKKSYVYDPFLAFLVKKLPDTYFLFYYPVFNVRKAQIELDIIIVTPTDIWLLHALPGNNQTIYQPYNDRFWVKNQKPEEEKILNPTIAVNRMKSVVSDVLREKNLTYSIKTAIIAKESFIDLPRKDHRLAIYDKRTFLEWFEPQKKNRTPVKHDQLKVTGAILNQCETNSELRSEFINDWEKKDS